MIMNLNLKRGLIAATALALMAGGGTAYATGGGHGGGHDPITICHKGKTITVDDDAWKAHKRHGDTKGACAPDPEPTNTSEPEPSESSEPEPSTSSEPEPSTSSEPEPSTSQEPEPTTGPSTPTKAPPVIVPVKPVDPPTSEPKSPNQKKIEKKATGKHKPKIGTSTKYDRDGNGQVDYFYAPNNAPISETGLMISAPQRLIGLVAMPDKVGHSARIKHRTDSKVSAIIVCIDRVSLTQCSTKAGNTYDLRRGETTTSKGDTDGYFCPARRDCRTYLGPVYTHVENSGSKSRKFVAVRGPVTYGVRVM